jgi:5-methylcytosine-specific restriction protein A
MPDFIPEGITASDVLDAIRRFDAGENRFFADSIRYDLVHEGRAYPPKAILGLAAERLAGRPLTPADFKGGLESRCFKILNSLGFTVKAKPLTAATFQVGRVYNRRADIHQPYGGQQQGGICTPAGCGAVFLFTGGSGKIYGYADGWAAEGYFRLFGEGQVGDMQFVAGNRAIRDHVSNWKELLLFENLGKGEGVRFIGNFAYAGHSIEKAPDKNGQTRDAIVFHLVPTADIQTAVEAVPTDTTVDFQELRRRAFATGTSGPTEGRQSVTTIYERSAVVRAYVLRRASGVCECCRKPAPFQRPDGQPYLEPHHVHRVSDGGPDHPAWVAVVCPNCHRQIHYGLGGDELNEKLRQHLSALEKSASE